MVETKRPINVDDIYNYFTVEDPQISPDGKWIAYVRVQADKMDDAYKRTIWLNSTDGGDPIQVTRSNKDFHPRWSPDSKTLGFISARKDRPQVYLLPLSLPGGEARVLTTMANGVTGFTWSNDGGRIAFLSSMNSEERAKEDAGEQPESPKDKLEGKHRKERKEYDEKLRSDPYFMWRIPYRAGTQFVGDRFSQIYVMPVAEGLEGDDAKPRRLTDLDANYGSPQWSVDDQYIYTSRQIDITADEPFRQSAIYRLHVEDSKEEAFTDETHTSFAGIPSPDGKWFAFARFPRNEGSMTEHNLRLTIMPADGGEARDLTLEFDRSITTFDWASDSKSIVFCGLSYGDGSLYKVDVESGDIETVSSGLFLAGGISVGKNNDIAFTFSTPTSPLELCWLPNGADEKTQITHFNKKFLDEVIVQETHEIRFTNSEGDEIQGWYILPVGYEEGQKYPLALNIHGGPHVMWGPSEPSMFHEWQFHVARGYAVFYCNPRGGYGYGEKFVQALHSAWGEVAFDDVMSGVDAVIEKGFVDTDRMAVTGGSYGGYMTAWIIGHTDRFVSAVSQRGVYNLISFYGTSDVPSLISMEFDGHPWEIHEKLWHHSPLAYAQDMKTPLLLIHAENDYRVPIEQAEQLFAFVRRTGGTVEMLRYPRDGHELSRSGEPRHRVSRLTEMVNWFDKYCMPEEVEA